MVVQKDANMCRLCSCQLWPFTWEVRDRGKRGYSNSSHITHRQLKTEGLGWWWGQKLSSLCHKPVVLQGVGVYSVVCAPDVGGSCGHLGMEAVDNHCAVPPSPHQYPATHSLNCALVARPPRCVTFTCVRRHHSSADVKTDFEKVTFGLEPKLLECCGGKRSGTSGRRKTQTESSSRQSLYLVLQTSGLRIFYFFFFFFRKWKASNLCH